jgi:hypothetical protein
MVRSLGEKQHVSRKGQHATTHTTEELGVAKTLSSEIWWL